jgi:hypothetical protein|tara:strand:- start:430 stop:621 length:192 start_codon:yes stop_codon:yes gene_type:complete
MKSKILLILISGLLLLLCMLVIGDFIVALQQNRPVDISIIHLIQITITGTIGVIGANINNKNK